MTVSVAKRWWHNHGLTAKQERVFHWIAMSVVAAIVVGWIFSIIELRQRKHEGTLTDAAGMPEEEIASPGVARSITARLLEPDAKTLPRISDAAVEVLDPLRGESGALQATFRTPGSEVTRPAGDVSARYEGTGDPIVDPRFRAPEEPGIYRLALQLKEATRPVKDLSVITLVPFQKKQQGKIGGYHLGSWPYERGGTPRSKKYANPPGFIEVTRENQDFHVSEHFRLRDFLTKDQRDRWPKYLLLEPQLLDKLELTIQELEATGVKVDHVFVMSGFRTPRYNHGGGNTSGRANLSRHMYGDAADVYVDNNRDGHPDDITGDGRVTVKDAERFAAMAERVEKKYPNLVGGIGIYVACCGHGPFTHIDVRGYRARWRGTGNG